MSTSQTADRVHESEAAIPMDAGFWSKVAAQQSEDDARETESIAEVNKPYRLSPPMTDQQRVEEPVFTTVQSVKDELAVWLSKGGDGQEVVRLLDQAELGRVKWGQVMTLQLLNYQTGRWILFCPPKASLRSLQGWYSFIRWELNWTGPIRVAVAA